MAALVGCGGGGGGGDGGRANTAPTAVAVADPQVGPVPLDVVLDGTESSDADGNVASYSWSFGDGSAAGAGATVNHTFDAPGVYQVQLTVTDDDGASASAMVDVEVIDGDPPQATASASPESGEAPLAVTFNGGGSTDPDGTIILYEWDFADGSSPGRGSSVTHLFEQPGIYDVTLRVVDDSGLSDTASVMVQVSPAGNQPPQAAFTATPEIGPAPLASQFDASASTDPDGQIASYQWDFGDGTAPGSGAAVAHTFTSNGVYQVALTVTDNFGAAASTTRTVLVGTRPVASIAASPDSGTPPLMVDFDGTGSSDSDGSITAYAWDFDDGDTSMDPAPSHTFQDPGDYQVTLTVTDDDGIPSEPATFVIEVTQDPASLSFRDFFDTDSVSQYDVSPSTAASYDGPGGRMQVIADAGTVEVVRNLPAEEEGFFRIRVLPTESASSAASFTVRLEETDTTYYEVFGVESVDGGEPSGGIRKVVNGTEVGTTPYPAKPLGVTPFGYRNDLVYSINVYFSPTRLTAEFTELGPRVLSIAAGDSTPIKVGRMRVVLQDQDAYLDEIIKEPISAPTLQYYVAFGDSITEGTSDNLLGDGRGYPILLQDELQANLETTHVVFNEGFGGWLSSQGVDLIDTLMARHPRAQFVLLQFGTNDASDGVTPATFRTNMQDMLNVIEGAGKVPYLARLPHRNNFNDNIDLYNAEIDDLAEDNELIVVPPDFACYFDDHPELIDADLTHPNGAGYLAMAQLWYKMIDLGQSGLPSQACSIP